MNRILGLDIVRSVAILWVVTVHSTYVFSEEVKQILLSWIPAIDGVSVFFVLSGFLIGGILLKTIEQTDFTIRDLGQFWIRRWFRTLPNYFLVVLLLFAYDVFVYRTDSAISYHYFVFTQNFAGSHPDFFPEAWSLSVEEWFYLLFPLFCFLGLKVYPHRRNVLLFVALVFLVGPLALRAIDYLRHFELVNYGNHYRKIVIFRLDSLMYGVLGAYIHRYKTALWIRMTKPGLALSVLLIVGMTLYSLGNWNWRFWEVYHDNLESIATLAALPYFSRLENVRSEKLAAGFTFISTISYAMYVLNLSIIEWRVIPAFLSITGLKGMASNHLGILSFALFWPFTLGASYLLYRYFERPIMNIRDRFTYGVRYGRP